MNVSLTSVSAAHQRKVLWGPKENQDYLGPQGSVVYLEYQERKERQGSEDYLAPQDSLEPTVSMVT